MKLTSLLTSCWQVAINKLVKSAIKLQQGGKIDKLQRVCNVFGCVFVFKRKKNSPVFFAVDRKARNVIYPL